VPKRLAGHRERKVTRVKHRKAFSLILASTLILSFLATADISAQSREGYKIGPQDVLTLKIYAGGKDQQEADLTVSSQGFVNVPFIGSVKALGLTTSQLEALITEALARDYFVDPQVNISVKGYYSVRSYISVEGEVKRPGVYDYQKGLTALNACILAGGFDKYAAPNRTIIIRKEGDEQTTIQINLDDVRPGKVPDVELKPGDRIHVPESWL